MLFLMTFLVSSLFVGLLQQVTGAPSAHLEGGDPVARNYQVNQVITTWNSFDPNSHVADGFGYSSGRLRVPVDGRYYVYAQMYFNSRTHSNNNRVAVYANNRLLLMIHKDMSANQENTGSTGGVFVLKRGDSIYVKVISYSTKMWLGPNHSYFGAYLI